MSRSYYVGLVPHCELFNASLLLNSSQDIVPSITSPPAVIELSNLVIVVTNSSSAADRAPNQLALLMAAVASLRIVNCTLRAPHIWILAGGTVTIDRASLLSVDGLAPSGLPDNPLLGSNLTGGEEGGGGGSGGVGGFGCRDWSKYAKGGGACGDPVTAPSEPEFGGPGSVATGNVSLSAADSADPVLGFGIGGGFIQVQVVSGDLIIDGLITANGTHGWHSTLPAGGGGGGFIRLSASGVVTGTAGSGGLVSANGGMGVNGGGGGAGGRIYILGGVTNYDVQAYGGGDSTAANTCPSPAQGGGQGTVYISTSNSSGSTVTSYVELRCIGLGANFDTSPIASTDFSNSSTVDKLTVTNCLLVTTEMVQLTSALNVYNSILSPATTGPRPWSLSIRSPYIEVSSRSSIWADSLSIVTQHLELGSSSSALDAIVFRQQATINSSSVLDVYGSIVAGNPWAGLGDSEAGAEEEDSGWLDEATAVLTMVAPSITLAQGSRVSASVVEISSASLQASGQIAASYERTGSNCSDALPLLGNGTCSALPFSFLSSQWLPWSSLVIQSRSAHLGNAALLSGAIIVVCSSSELSVDGGTVSSSYMGCAANQGVGHGSPAGSGQPGGGAGHGGVGGPGISASSPLTLDGGAGESYDNGSVPCMVGSGGGSSSSGGPGGVGGGLIYLEAAVLTLSSHSAIVSDGGSGTLGLNGGGSGGSVVLHIGSIAGPSAVPATISASGGAGTGLSANSKVDGGSGGGGGGGRILVRWFDTPPLNQQDAIVFQVLGGNASAVLSLGQSGSLVSQPACAPGYAGVLCLSCPIGSYKNASGPSDCVLCEAGSFSNVSSAAHCLPCEPGSFSLQNSSSCLACAAGSFSGAGNSSCTQCPRGWESNEERSGCQQCEMGAYRDGSLTACKACEPGSYSNAEFDGCLSCPSAPSHSHYISLIGSQCPYECDVGFLLPDCTTPFWSMVNSMGGVLVFAAFLLLAVAVTFVPFLCCFIRSKRRQREREILEMDEAETDSEADSLPPSPPSQQGGIGRSFSAAPSYDHSTLNTSLLQRGRTLTLKELPSSSLQPRHYPHHLHRLYLSGDNSFSRPFALSPLVPQQISQMVFQYEYAAFASELSELGRWSQSERALHFLLCLLCLPLASFYLHRRRRARVLRLWHFVLNYDHGMLRNAKSRALASSLLFGSSSCATLAWIDVLANSAEEKLQSASATGLPRLPLVLVASGDGSFHTPFHFDVSDAYAKSITDYVGMNWHKFLRGVNAHLRCIRLTQLFSQQRLAPLLQFLRVENHMGIGIGRHLPLGGVRVELGWIAEEAAVGGSALPALIISAKEETGAALSITSTLHAGEEGRRHAPAAVLSRHQLQPHQPSYRRDDRSPQSSDSGRDAAVLSQSYTSSSYLTSDEEEEAVPSIMERALGHRGKAQVEKFLASKQQLEAEQRRLQLKLASSYASLPGQGRDHEEEQQQRGGGYRAFGRKKEQRAEKELPEPRSGSRKRRGSLQTAEHKEEAEPGSLLDSSVVVQDAAPPLSLPYQASVFRFGVSPSASTFNSPRHRRIFSVNAHGATPVSSSLSAASSQLPDAPLQPAVSFAYRVQGLLLFNVRMRLSRTLVACCFLLLLFLRLCLSLVLLSSSYQLLRWLFVLSLLLYPAAPALIPLLGVAALVSSSTHACRFFSAAVLLSLCNDLALILGSVYAFNTALGYIDAILLPALALCLTVLLLLTSHAYVAHLDWLKDLVLGRSQSREEAEAAASGAQPQLNQSPQSSKRGSRRGSVQTKAAEGERQRERRKGRESRDGWSKAAEEEKRAGGEAQQQQQLSVNPAADDPVTPVQLAHESSVSIAAPARQLSSSELPTPPALQTPTASTRADSEVSPLDAGQRTAAPHDGASYS